LLLLKSKPEIVFINLNRKKRSVKNSATNQSVFLLFAIKTCDVTNYGRMHNYSLHNQKPSYNPIETCWNRKVLYSLYKKYLRQFTSTNGHSLSETITVLSLDTSK